MKKSIRVLHIDDNLFDRQLVKDAFRSFGEEFEVIEVENRTTFEEQLNKDNFDLVLSDFNILGFDGFQVLDQVRQKRPEVPVIIVTGTGSEEVAIQAMKLGVDDYVIKTASHIQNLIPAVRKVLEKKRMEREFAATVEALKESEERFRLLFEHSMDAVMLTVPDGKIISVNPAACEIFGKTEEEIISGGREGIIDTSDPRLEEAIKISAVTGKFFGELTGKRKDGSLFPIEVSAALFMEKTGKMNTSMIIRDISHRKAAEEALRKKLAQLERFHQLTIDRELAMIDLKKEVNELLKKLGLPEKYK